MTLSSSTALRLAKIVAVYAAIETLFWGFGVLSIQRGNAYRQYYPSALAAQIEANLLRERAAPPTGWGDGTPRSHPAVGIMPPCGSAWGGSFTVNDDVSDAEAWPYRLSVKLGCEIENRGVDGFGTDQTLVLFENHLPHDSIVILGMAQPMITVDGASSWTFLELDNHLPYARITKPLFRKQSDRLVLIPRPGATVAEIERHYAEDIYGRYWTPLRFPFSLSVVRAMLRKFRGPDLNVGAMADLADLRELRAVTVALIARMAEAAKANNNRFVLLLIPRPEDALGPNAAFSDMLKTVPSVCLIDPSEDLKNAVRLLPDPASIMTKSKHFDAQANQMLADATAKGLANCGIKP